MPAAQDSDRLCLGIFSLLTVKLRIVSFNPTSPDGEEGYMLQQRTDLLVQGFFYLNFEYHSYLPHFKFGRQFFVFYS